MPAKKGAGKGKPMDPDLRQMYKLAMIANSGIRNYKSHGSIHRKADKHVIPALEKAFASPGGYYLPNLVGGSKKQYQAIKSQRVVYIRDGPQVSIHRTEGKISRVGGQPRGYEPSPLQVYKKVNGVWVRVRTR